MMERVYRMLEALSGKLTSQDIGGEGQEQPLE